MNGIEIGLNRLISLSNSVEKITIEEIRKESKLISDLNRDQLMKGIDAFGNPTPEYSESSKKKGKRGRIKFFDTGDYQKAIKPVFDNEGIDIESTDFKNAFLNPYKKVIETLGLTNESIIQLQNKILPRIIKRLRLM
ncbi:MAG: hypothetical protein MK076_05445 [Flavobacteriales bacterium]|nr:hypothetical protein [Flavobacteriales bacterium]